MTRLVLRGGLVFDGTGVPPYLADVAVEGERITEVGTALAGDEIVELDGALVAPGLIDCHVHTVFDGMDLARIQSRPFSLEFFEAAANLGRLLGSGVTTVRDAGGADLGVKTAVETGLVDGPRMQIAVSVLSQTGGHADGWNVHGDLQRLLVPHPGRPDCVVDGVDAMRKRVRELVRAGADVIKVCASGGVMSTRDDPRHPQFTYDELAACVDEAAAVELPVMAHAHGAAGIKQALRAGVRSIEHGVFLDDECIDLFLERDAWLVPTLMAPASLVEAIDAGMSVTPEIETKARSIAATHLDAVTRAHQGGVRIAMGTDSGVFAHGSSPEELAWLVRAGLSPQEALLAATSSAADLLALPDVGRITPRTVADLVILDGDPWQLEKFRENLRLVIKSGRIRRPADQTDARHPE
ncbi:metal-dependent hydrolase family protein [Kribbella shirazensis]|uniref:Imidazolonepropionase-like amidohydrolase n=1 Tax=Kribbella shirazensis TaxID=1105143 RepID=A0A7X5VHP6_9ACTN|nr:amidohydrolase family protein [Kribbella shirazensis]NIK61500.1 imidazolonepropionase-like amidohydrolase [Kribbella shirazensis]